MRVGANVSYVVVQTLVRPEKERDMTGDETNHSFEE